MASALYKNSKSSFNKMIKTSIFKQKLRELFFQKKVVQNLIKRCSTFTLFEGTLISRIESALEKI